MSNKFVRSSKYRHVFADTPKREDIWDGIKMTKNAWDSNWAACSSLYVAVAWHVGGGGAVGILDASKPGKLEPSNVPLVSGHKGPVLDMQFDPFNDDILTTVSEDALVRVWKIPENMTGQMTDPVQVLKGHKRKVGVLAYNGTASNVLATASQDYEVKVWDVETGTDKFTIGGPTNLIQSLDWNYDGSLITYYSKDKKMRVTDPRQSKVVHEVDSHPGVKGGRSIFCGKHNRIFTVGFGKGASREYAVWDLANMDAPIVPPTNIDTSAGVLMPFYDEDSDVLFLAGKGDGNLRYYEFVHEEEPKKMIYPISAYSSNESLSGCCALGRRGCDISACEIMRLYKVTPTAVHPLKFCVPRKSDLFQDDLYPDCRSDEAALTAAQWLDGETSVPKLKPISESGFQKKATSEVTFSKREESSGPSGSSGDVDALHKRIAELEALLKEKDARIAELESSNQ